MKPFHFPLILAFQIAVLSVQAASLSSLYSFTGSSDGLGPQSALMQAADGNLYGGASATLFRETPTGNFTVLATMPTAMQGPLVQGPDGALYGTTYSGGASGKGSIFKVTTNGQLTTLYSFTGGADGANCAGGLILASDGAFYGATARGASGYGTIFRFTHPTLSTLYTFTGGADSGIPRGELVQGSDGMLYGVAGLLNPTYHLPYVVFKLSVAGAFTVLHNFVSTEGYQPSGRLVEMPDGNLYGTAMSNGGNGYGSIFAVNPTGSFVAYALPNSGSVGGVNPLVKGVDGSLYGTIRYRGSSNLGLIYRFTTNGTLTELYSFTGGADGGQPTAPLLQGRDGNFYGTTQYGGNNNYGTVFRLNVFPPPNATTQPATQVGGTTATLNGTFNAAGLSTAAFFAWGTNSTDENRTAPTVQGAGTSDLAISASLTNLTPDTSYHFTIGASNLYGMVTLGSDQVFTTVGLPTIASFSPVTGAAGSTVTLLGTHLTGASSVLFNGQPALFTVVSDTQLDATVPQTASGPISVTTTGGTTVTTSNFTVIPWPTISSLSPTRGSPGTNVTISGSNLANVTEVAFSGVPAAFSIDSDSQLTAIVPDCAGNGFVTATSPGGTATSPNPFAVIVVKPSLTLSNADPVALSTYLCGGGTVNFACSGTLVLTNTFVIAADTTLDGTGQSVTLSGNNLNRILSVNPGVKLTLRNITLANGRDPAGTGGALFNDGGIVAASDCTFSFNSAIPASGDAYGGALYNNLWGRLTLERCTFFNNSAIGSQGAQGAYPGGTGGAGGNAFGGALCNNGGSVLLTNCTFSANQAMGGNGGQGAQGRNGYYYSCGFGGTCFSPPGPSGNGGTAGSAFGGNIYNTTNNTVLSGTINLNSATIASGRASGGSGGMGGPPGSYGSSWGTPGAPGNGFGGNLAIGNSALGMPAVFVYNTLIANSASGVNCWGNLGDGGYNASSDLSCNFTSSNSHSGWTLSLGPLANNGGATMTLALSPDSPLLNAGAPNAPAFDQRGLPRMVFGFNDIGAFEVQDSLFLTLQGDPSMTNECHAQFIDPGVVASNLVGADLSQSVVVAGSVDISLPGTYTITYSLAEGALTNSVTRSVTIVDTTPPTLTLLGANPLVLPFGAAYVEPGAMAADTCSGDLSGSIIISGIVTNNLPGSYTLSYTVADPSGNATNAQREVIVQPPGQPTTPLLVEDFFDGTSGNSPDASRFEWSGEVTLNGAGQLGLGTWSVNRSWIKSKASAALTQGQALDVQFAAYAYAEGWDPGVYGDGQPRGLRVGTDDNNVVEFYSIARTTLGLRTRLNGNETLVSYPFPAGVDSMHQYQITVTSTGAVFRVDGELAGIITSNIPTDALNFYATTFDGYAGNVPAALDSLQFSRVGGQNPPTVATTAASALVTAGSLASATLNGTVNPNDDATAAWFAWGTTTNYDNTTPVQLLDGGTNTLSIAAGLANLSAHTVYHYCLIATNSGGMRLGQDQIIDLQLLPAAPSGLAATAVCAGQVDLTWSDNATNEAGLLVERQIGDGGAWTVVAMLGADTTRYRASAIMPDTTNYFRVSAWNMAGASASPPLLVEPQLLGTGTVAGWGETGWNLISVPAGLSNIVTVAAGYYGSVALRRDGTVVGWGASSSPGTTVPANLSNVVAIAAGVNGLALKRNNTVVGWGDNSYGEAVPPIGLSNVVAIGAGEYYCEALKSDGTVVAWGWGGFGQTAVPSGLSNVVAISAGGKHSLALRSDGQIVTWGDNRYSQRNVPASATNVIAVAAGYWHSLALRADGSVVGWGSNASGETTPPAGLSNVVAIAAGNGFSLALQRNGLVVGWGSNGSGTGQAIPPGNLGMASAISAGYMHSLAVQGSFVTATLPYLMSFSATNAGTLQLLGFSFTIAGATNMPFLVEACANPGRDAWVPLLTNTLATGSFYFTDPAATNSPRRFYRIRSP